MPIYEYECKACGHKLEKLQKISDAQLKECPSCSKPELTKLVSAAAFRLKGGGWYETDFKTGGKKNVLHGADSGSNSSSSASTDSNSSGGSATSDTSKSDKSGDSSTKSKPDVSAAAS